MKFRSFLTVLIVGVAVLLLMGAGGFYWLTANSPLALLQGGDKASPAAAMFVPKQAPAMVSLLVNPDRLERLRLAAVPPGERNRARAELEQLKRNFLADAGVDYGQEVQSWLGDELTLSVTTPDVDRNSQNGQQPGYLLALATRNPVQAREFLQVFWQKRAIAGADLVFEQYAGVKLIHSNTGGGTADQTVGLDDTAPEQPSLTSAVVGDRFVLFANYPKVLRDAINNVQAPDLSLSQSPSFQRGLESLPDRAIGLAFLDLPQLQVLLGNEATGVISRLAASSGASPLYESVLMNFALEGSGLLAETVLLPALGKSLTPVEPTLSGPVEALKFIPSESPFTAAGTDLRNLWSQVEAGLVGYDTAAALFYEPMQALQSQWGVQATEDLVGWVTGDYALGVLPKAEQAKPDWILVTQRSSETEAALEHLDHLAQQQGLSTGVLSIGDEPVTAWTKLSTASAPNGRRRKAPRPMVVEAEVQGIRAQIEDYEIFATSVEAMDQALQASTRPLSKTPGFQKAIAPLDRTNEGYLYLNWRNVRDAVTQRFPLVKLAELSAKPILDHVRSVTLSSYGSESDLRRGAVFVRFKD